MVGVAHGINGAWRHGNRRGVVISILHQSYGMARRAARDIDVEEDIGKQNR